MPRSVLRFCLMMGALATFPTFAVDDGLGQGQHAPKTAESPSDRSLRNYLADYGEGTKYYPAFVDLRDDGKQEVIVYLMDQDSCGTGGCRTLILAPEGSSYKLVTRIIIARLPIRVLATKSNGWHDIGVWVQGGGIQPGYEANLSFNGKRYPSNPSVPPAGRILTKAAGKVVVPLTAWDTPTLVGSHSRISPKETKAKSR